MYKAFFILFCLKKLKIRFKIGNQAFYYLSDSPPKMCTSLKFKKITRLWTSIKSFKICDPSLFKILHKFGINKGLIQFL